MEKKKAFTLRTIISVILVLVAVAIAVPMHSLLVRVANTVTNNLVEKIENQTNLKISYEALSPSILSTININQIFVLNKNDEKLLEINKVKVNYKLLKILKLDITNGVSNILIDGIELDIHKLVDFISSLNILYDPDFKIDIEKIKSFIPGNIKLKNVNLLYANEQLESSLLVKDIVLNNSNTDSVSLSLNSKANAKLIDLGQKLSCGLNLSATVYTALDNSNVTLKFTDITNGNISLSKLCLLAEYNNKAFSVNTIQTVNPIYIEALYNLETKIGDASLKTENLNALSLLSINSSQKELKKFKNLTINTDTSVSCNLGNLQNLFFDYYSKGSVYIPPEVISGAATISYDLNGNQSEVSVNSLSVNGERCSFDVQLDYLFKNMQLSGYAQLPFFMLPNGNLISSEIYFDPLEKGFMMFSPQTFIGEKSITALQASFLPEDDSYDFMIEAFDYSHFEAGEPGSFKIDGSYLQKSNYIQSNLSLNSIYLDSILDFALQLIDATKIPNLEKVRESVNPYIFSADTYISTDFKSISYSVPYVLLANTKQDSQVLMISANGNEQSVSVDHLSLVYGKYALSAAAAIDIDTFTKDMFYTLDLNFETLPYHFSGNIMKESVTLTGDYGIDVQVHFGKDKKIAGYAMVENLPFVVGTESFIFTLNSSFNYDVENGPDVNISQISLEDASPSYSVSPKIIASANVSKYGAQINSITYTDYYSTLEGSADLTLNINENIFDSVGLNLNVKNPRSDETISVDANVSNPDHKALNSQNLLKDLYLSSQIQINNFSLNRFTKSKHENNYMTGVLSATGTLEHPYVALNVEKISILLSTSFWEFYGIAILEDKNVSIQDFNIICPGMKFKEINADFSLEEFTGNAGAIFQLGEENNGIILPISLQVDNTVMPSKGFVPEMATATVSVHDVSGSLVKKPFELNIGAFFSNNVINLFTDDKTGISGTIGLDGKLNVVSENPNVKLKVIGEFSKAYSSIKFADMDVQLQPICSFLNLDDVFLVKDGSLTGNFTLCGDLDDPDFKGAVKVNNPRVKMPQMFKNDITTDKILITAVNNTFQIVENYYEIGGDKRALISCRVIFNKWSLDHIDVLIKSYPKAAIPFNWNLGFFTFIGDVVGELSIVYQADDNYIDYKGKLFGENVNIVSGISDISQSIPQTKNQKTEPTAIFTDLDISLGNHAALTFDPVLRAIFVPNTKLILKIDSDAGMYHVDGKLNLKSGDVAYLNRNFYIKNGSIKFNPTDLSNPLVTLRAETRERDEEGNNVKIILSAENQFLKDLNPHFTSEPAKSELEIQSLLGQIVAADSEKASSFIWAASDYALQSMLFRKTENKLRDLLNFDIFSLRTNVLQNSVGYYNNDFSNRKVGIGNLLDNSTVYIGKYVGSSLYFDAMLQVSFEDNIHDITAPGALYFQPDFGMELESPFGNIRWNMTPDINALMHNEFVPSTSVSVSWKFSF